MHSESCRPYLPPEWAPQSGVMLTWPHKQSDWAATLEDIEPVFVDIARHIACHERLLLVCFDETHRDHVRAALKDAKVDLAQTRFYCVPSDDSWARDHGPLTVLCQGESRLLDFQFNGWGNKYPAALDNQISRALSLAGAFDAVSMETVPWVLEGGSIDVDGSGTLLTTQRCLLSPNRNPEWTRPDLEAALKDRLGIKRILWLQHGYLAGDDTDSHIDTLARFCDPETIAYVACDDPADEHYAELQAMETELQHFRSATGRPYRLVPLPWPRPVYDDAGQRLPATYANFLIINSAVLVPTYDDPADESAQACLARHFPGHEIIGVRCGPLLRQHGSLHCVTMQLPAGVLLD